MLIYSMWFIDSVGLTVNIMKIKLILKLRSDARSCCYHYIVLYIVFCIVVNSLWCHGTTLNCGVIIVTVLWPSIKYVTLFWTNFDSPPSVTLWHTSRNPLKYVTPLSPPN